MLPGKLGQQLLLPGRNRRALRLGLVSVVGAIAVGTRLRIETEERAVVGALEGVDLRLESAEANLGV